MIERHMVSTLCNSPTLDVAAGRVLLGGASTSTTSSATIAALTTNKDLHSTSTSVVTTHHAHHPSSAHPATAGCHYLVSSKLVMMVELL